MTRYALISLLLLAACGKDSMSVKPTPQVMHDPEIYFHYAPNNAPAAGYDTVVMEWYKGTTADSPAVALAAVQLTGTADSLCAYFLVPNLTQMYFKIYWKRSDIVPPPTETLSLDTTSSSFWDIEPTLTGSTSFSVATFDRNTVTYCPHPLARDSVGPALP